MKAASTKRSRLGPAAGSNESNKRPEAEFEVPLIIGVRRLSFELVIGLSEATRSIEEDDA
jgi:hypothetical protein